MEKDYVMVCIGLMGSTQVGNPEIPIGAYLRSYNPEAYRGRGFAEWTTELSEAKRYESAADAFTEWTRVPKGRPRREDGKPNKPLTAYSIEVVKASTLESEGIL